MLQDPRLPGVCIDQSEPWHRAFREHLLEIIALDQKKPEFYELDVVIGLQRMWRLLLSHITYEPQNVQENSPDYDRLRSILSYIEENYRNPITLKDISGHIHLCESECTRLFKRHMNTTLFTYLQEYRIERSLEDLCKGKTISATAEKAGFSDSNYYSKVFAKVKGCSPREYKKRQYPHGLPEKAFPPSAPLPCDFCHLRLTLCHQVRLKEVRMWQIISVLEAYPAPVTQNRYCLLVGWKNIIALQSLSSTR